MTAQPNHHVAHVGQPLLDIVVARAGEQRRVFLEQAVECALRALSLLDDPGANLGGESRIVQDRLVSAKDGRLVPADLAGDFLIEGVQIGGGFFTRLVVSSQLGQGLVLLEPPRVGIDVDLVDAISRTNGHTRRNANPLSHVPNRSNAASKKQ